MGGSGFICFPTNSHPGQSGREAAGLPMQENHSDFSRVAKHAGLRDLVAMSSQIPLSLPNLLVQPFNQTPRRNLPNLILLAWLLEPRLLKNRASLRQWHHELRLLKEDQPDQSMRQSGPFVQRSTSVIRCTSGQPL